MADSLVVDIEGRDNLSSELKKIESGVIRFVGAVSAALSTLSAIGFPIVSAANFQKELLNAAKTTNYTRDQIGELRQGLDDLSKQSNISAIDFAKIATLGGQLGIGENNVSALLEFTKQIGVAITALDIPADEAVDSIGKLINIFNVPASQFKNLISSLNEVSNSSTATASQLFDVVRRIGNLGGSVDIPAAAALSASMIDLGLTAETAGTTITKIFADMKSNAAAFANIAVKAIDGVDGSTQLVKMTTEEWVRLVEKDGLSALKAYVTGLNQLGTAQAAQVKSQLTGEGRLFEAVTKLQQQQLRQASVQQALTAAERDLANAKRTGSRATAEQIAAEQQRVDALKAAAIQANVLDRLNTKATQAFNTADSAVREQETTMAGLIAQWSRFQNNMISVVNTVGGQFLAPITGSLRGLSDSLEASAAGDQLKEAADDIVSSIRRIGDAFAFLRTFTQGTLTFDWGSALRIGALIAAMGVFKGVTSLLKSFGGAALSSVPGLTQLRQALLGTSQAERELQAAQAARAAKSATTGGLLSTTATKINEQVNAYIEAAKRLTEARNRAEATRNAAFNAIPAAQQAVAASFARLPYYITSIGDAQARLARYTASYDAAIAAGNTRAAAGFQRQIIPLQATLAAIQANQAALNRYVTTMQRAEQALNLSNAGLNRLVPSPLPALSGMADAARRAATTFKASFGAAIASGGNPLSALFSAIGALSSPATNSGEELGRNFLSGFGSALSKGAAATVSGIGSAFSSLLGISGITEKFADAPTKMAKSLVVLTGAFTALRTVASLAFAVLSRFIGIVFFAMMAKELLELLGLWDKFLLSVQKVVTWVNEKLAKLGFKTIELPDFLKTKTQVDAVAKSVEKVAANMEMAREEAAKFGEQQAANLTILTRAPKAAQQDLKFNPADPGKSAQAQKDYLEAVAVSYSKAEVAANAYYETEKQLRLAEVESSTAADKLAKAKEKYKDVIDAVGKAEQNLANVRATSGEDKGAIAKAEKELSDAQAQFARARLFGFADLERNADAAASKVSELGRTLGNFRTQLGQVGGTGDDPFSGINTATKTLVASLFTAKEAQDLFLSTGQDTAPFVRWVEAMLAERDAADKLAEAHRKLTAEKDTQGRSDAAIATVSAEYEAAKVNAEAAAKATAKVATEVEKLGRSPTQIREFMASFNSKNPNAVARELGAIVDAANTLKASDFKGLAVPEIKADSLISAAATFAVKSRLKDMYDAWATNAKLAAERAKNAATTAIADVKRLADQAIVANEKITQSFAANKDKASRQKSDRLDDADSRQRLRNLQTEYDTEKALLEAQFSQQQRVLAEQEAGGARVFAEKQQAYAFEQQALFELEEKYNKLKEAEQDRLNLQKQRRAVKDEIKAFDELIKKVEYYKKRVTEANNTLADPSAKLETKAGAIETRTAALEKMKAIYGQLEAAGERIASTDPIGGELVVNTAQVEKVKNALTAVADTIGKVGVQSSDQIEPVFKELATKFSNMSGAMAKEMDVAGQAFAKLSGVAGPELDALFAKYSALVAQNSQFADGVEKLQGILQKGLTAPGTVDLAALSTFSEGLAKMITQAGDSAKITLTVDEQASAGNIANGLKATLGQVATGVPIAVSATGESLTAMGNQITKGVTAEVNLTGKLDAIKGPDGTIVWGVPKNARGGLIGDVVHLAQGISRFATGGAVGSIGKAMGKISGPGDGTSDNILSWLSNGEFVIDALTTSRFGAGFFRMLQEAARSGTSLSFLNKLSMPRFAVGGPVAPRPVASFSGIANDFKMPNTAGSRDVVDVNIQFGERRATIQASREQAKNLVGILRTFDRG